MGLGGGPKTRNAKPSTWSVDLSVIDLPTGKSISSILLCYLVFHTFTSQRLLTGSKYTLLAGGEVVGFDGIPSWNVLTDDHIKFSLVVASTVMDDMGWVLVLCPSTSLVRVERMAIRAGLQLGFRWILESSEPFSSITRHGDTQKVNHHFLEKFDNLILYILLYFSLYLFDIILSLLSMNLYRWVYFMLWHFIRLVWILHLNMRVLKR